MTDAKVPDNKSDWKSIDIYLFSNGQQSSPPRKYHLVTNHLEWWKATLNYLAKAQYGSLHSMVDLYTIDGKKIETPLQLSHNTTYVAVAPPDAFIDAGYDKYLIKATRSWEKGQERRASNTAEIKPEEIHTVNGKSTSYLKDVTDGTLKTIVASMVDNQASLIVKPQATSNKQTNLTAHLSPGKQKDQVNISSVQRSSIEKKNNIIPSPPRSRKPSLRRKESVKINPDTINNRISSDDAKINKIPIRSKIYKPMQKQRNSLPETILPKVEEVANELKSSSSFKELHDKSSETKATEIENVILDKDLIMASNIFKNADIENSPTVNHSILISDNVNRQGGVHELFDEHRKSIESTYGKISTMRYDTDMSLMKNTYDKSLDEYELSSPIASKANKTDNNVARAIQEGTVNMKLKIEICSNPNETATNPDVTSKTESLIILKPEMPIPHSQVHIADKLLQHDNPLQKNTANEISGNEENHKVIIVQCTCFNQGADEGKNTVLPLNGNNNLLVFLPVLKLDEDRKRCECKENKDIGTSCESSFYYPVKQTTSCISIHKERAEKIVSYSEITSRNNSTETKVEITEDKNEMTAIKRKSVAIKETQENLPLQIEKPLEEYTKVVVPLPEPDKLEFVVIKKESTVSTGILHKIANKLTQTEWCDVLLEVKLQDDGHYSFHLPPLAMLKNYKL